MNLRSVDLNLLVILDALLDEAHVSRTAQRLHLSQPAVSSALQRCRDLFDDPLLERGRGEMTRTTKAESLRAPLKSLLGEVINLLDPPEVQLADLVQRVRITSADAPIAMLAGPLIAALRSSCPGITVIFQPWHGSEESLRGLKDGDAELAIAVFEQHVDDIEIRTLIEQDYVIAMRHGHPASKQFNLDSWLDSTHVIVSGQGELHSPLDAVLKARGRTRRIGMVVPAFHPIPRILAESDFVAMIPRHSLPFGEHPELVTFDPPFAIESFPLHLAWHTRQSKDLGVMHVADLIQSSFNKLDR